MRETDLVPLAARASPTRSNGSHRPPPRSTISAPPTPLSGTPTANGWSRCRPSTGCRSACCAGSTGCATSCSQTPSASRPGCRPTTCCCGARAAPARAPWSRRPTPRSTRPGPSAPGALALIEIHREDIPTLPRLLSLVRDSGRRCDPVLRRPVVRPERRQLQIAESGARRRHRGPARPMSCSTRPRTGAT